MKQKMPANIPFNIQEKIIKRVVEVKSLLRFRLVSQQWKTLIDSSQFITHNTFYHTKPDHLLVSYRDKDDNEIYVSIADDDTFPHNKVPLSVPPTFVLLDGATIVGCSHGLVGFVTSNPKPPVTGKQLLALWNPSIRKSVGIVVAYGFTAMGFGVCRETGNLKIVKCTDAGEADLFSLRTKSSYRIPMNLSVPFRKQGLYPKHVAIDGVIYWTDFDQDTGIRRIVAFDLTAEEFEEVLHLPDDFSHEDVSIFNLNESLAVVNHDAESPEGSVWMMVKHHDSKYSLTKVSDVLLYGTDGSSLFDIVGFRKSGHLVTRRVSTIDRFRNLEPSTQCIDDLGFDTTSCFNMEMTSYTESLLLLRYTDNLIRF